jgi:hypothetical protein
MRIRAVAILLSFVALASPALSAKIEIIISKPTQKMTVYINGEPEYVWPVSTGAPGYDTPSGNFRANRMVEDHESKEWDNAPMPHAIFFTERGHAIHGSYSRRIGVRASHGCVRLAPQNAAELFALVEENGLSNTRVSVKGGFFDNLFQNELGGKIQKSNAPTAKLTRPKITAQSFWGIRKPVAKKKPLAVKKPVVVKNTAAKKKPKVVKVARGN